MSNAVMIMRLIVELMTLLERVQEAGADPTDEQMDAAAARAGLARGRWARMRDAAREGNDGGE